MQGMGGVGGDIGGDWGLGRYWWEGGDEMRRGRYGGEILRIDM